MSEQAPLQPDDRPFNLDIQPQDDPSVPRQLLGEEIDRLTALPAYKWVYEVRHPGLPVPPGGPFDATILDAFELRAFGIISRQDTDKGPRVTVAERRFFKEFLGITGSARDLTIKNTYGRRSKYLSVLKRADQFGLSIAEAKEDVDSGRAPLLAGLFHNAKLQIELQRKNGGNISFKPASDQGNT